ncbi:unnamed protein product [Brassica rapa]|uniref:non-specific serine/threonine protein kinase n=1 Tax=Brassica campestris TaxID=3711 RepID=A0A3P5ZQ01_BRACM|nr:unnamed protein product [Brassica rapa]VDC82387.1 unnamed protein product [Brassica rapa]
MLLEAFPFSYETDRKSLLAFKSQVSESKRDVLSSWNNSVSMCNWKGVTCGHKHKRVIELNLAGLQLGGVISPSIGNLSFLISLDLSNNSFGGAIPQEVGNLFRLVFLSMSSNALSGEIPIGVFNCSRLIELYLDSNHLGGGIPSEIGSLTNLYSLNICENNLEGKLPTSLGNMTSIMQVKIYRNNLEGEIPYDITTSWNQMVFLDLSINKFSGSFPPPIYNFTSLRYLSISDNYFTGAIPATLSNISTLQMLAIDNNTLTGSIPPSFGKLRNLRYLALRYNSLGSHSFGDVEFLGGLTNCTQLEVLTVAGNRLGGHLPASIANLSINLRGLNLGNNFISGSIPHDIGRLVNLQTLGLQENQLKGLLPTSIGKLLQLGLFNNSFEGTIPLSLANCTSLRFLWIGSNRLDGPIPWEIMGTQSLVELDVSGNSLTGYLPKDVGRLGNLVALAAADNKLSGKIPPSLGNCLSMVTLFLQGNYFDGAIPDIRGLKGLKRVDFSRNSLSGSIPGYLSDFSSLEYLNLSVNNFEGNLPAEGKFRNTTIVSVFGNKNLCGGIKGFKLKPCFTETQRRRSKHHFLLNKAVIGVSGSIALLLLLFVVFVLLRWFRKGKKNHITNNPTPSTLEVFHEKISYGEIRNATDGFSLSNMIGSGSFGTVFKALFPADNKVVAVKVLNMQIRGAMKSFMAECESLKNIRHRNLVKLLTACSSIDFQGNEFRALVYEFMSNGSLDMWLHPGEVEEILRPSRTLTLLERLNIGIDVASVLDYLHVHCHEPIAHCDIKPSNVLLDDDFTAHVSDFGLARLLLKFNQESFFNQLSSAGVRGTIGYAAPEYGMGGQPTIHGDVYSFGVLLLEMFTGKRPTNELFGGNFTLNSYTKSALPERVLDVVDKSILQNGLKVGFPVVECLTLVLEVGLRCCEESPANRLATSEAKKELISIRERFFKATRTARG